MKWLRYSALPPLAPVTVPSSSRIISSACSLHYDMYHFLTSLCISSICLSSVTSPPQETSDQTNQKEARKDTSTIRMPSRRICRRNFKGLLQSHEDTSRSKGMNTQQR